MILFKQKRREERKDDRDIFRKSIIIFRQETTNPQDTEEASASEIPEESEEPSEEPVEELSPVEEEIKAIAEAEISDIVEFGDFGEITSIILRYPGRTVS